MSRQPLSLLAAFSDLTGRYKAVFCDVWGVVHDGVAAFPDATQALVRARNAGLAVVLVTNAPRPHGPVEAQLRALGVPDEAWDRVVTSGDVTRELIAKGPKRVLHIGPERDVALFDGLEAELSDEREADAVVCTGLADDIRETPEHYGELLRRLRGRDLPMICANPDITIERGGQTVWCAGAIARDYALLGGRTLIAGKPFAPIYVAAMAAACEVSGETIARADVLAVGDGMLTDVKGAADFGLDTLYVSGGVHWRDYGEAAHAPDPARLHSFLTTHGRRPVAVMAALR